MTKEFTIKKIDDGVYQIRETWFKEHANLYLFQGNKSNLLIDCGLGIFNLNDFLANQGFKNVQVALTHAHFDHAGGFKHFQNNKNFITPAIKKNLRNRGLWGLEYLNNEDLSSEIFAKFATAEKLQDSFRILSIKNTLQKLSQIDIGSFYFDLINLPGHTNDSVAYWEKEKGILVTGDALYDGEIYFDFINSDKQKFKKSLEIISKTDFTKALPGHNQILGRAKVLNVAKSWMKECI